ncbi:5-hydroxytryptamine receptor 1A-like [Anneissia japonica]|uniref:5-hydroxytryptamine receptor 1A-like n=1 Tax=Anneissia japonica TaxID=1529436 RepID=UPI00142579BC|nr:5-hydroxytryptamine receptor 1A-like [Anneissia japonica]
MEYMTLSNPTELDVTLNSTGSTSMINGTVNEISGGLIVYIIVVFVPIGMVSIIGNAVVVLTIYRYPSLQIVRNYYIGSLAVADFLTGCIAVPGAIMHYILIRGSFSGANMRDGVTIYVMPLFLFSWASIHNLLLITWDRYLAVVHPLDYVSKATKKRAFLYITVAWAVSFIPILIPFFWGMDTNGHGTIRIKSNANMIRNYICSGYFFIILTIMVKLHMSTYIIARKKERELPGTIISTKQKHGSELAIELQLKSFKTISLVLIVFVTCLTPLTVLTYVEYIWSVSIPWLVWFTEAIVFASSMVNPFIYAYRRQDFRQAFKRTFRCKLSHSALSTTTV